ncbi:MAG: DUF2461 domain-containing protein [Bacteroidales bacterium]|nr:DUF2461 domain-containing protein [Bacteroidales bacterium]
MNISGILEFLRRLSQNNNREWFNEHKALYTESREYHFQLIEKLIMLLADFDTELRHLKPQECIFRIHRDLRFSQDKTPYKNHLGAFMTLGGKNNDRAGYYLHLQPDNCFITGGIWMPAAPQLKILRHSIIENLDEFEDIIHAQSFRENFGTMDGRRLLTAPKGFPIDFPGMDYLKYKDYTATHKLNSEETERSDFCEYIAGIFQQLYPLNRFLNYALDEHQENKQLYNQ